jgi:hypothetical protein
LTIQLGVVKNRDTTSRAKYAKEPTPDVFAD